MNRREFIAGTMGAAACSFGARAQQARVQRTIAFLGATTPAAEGERLARLVQRLGELGWNEDRNIRLEVRWAEGDSERFAEVAAEFVRLRVDVIVTYGTPAALAAKQATSEIPIVFIGAGDPVGTGLVRSLARPGGNVTGLSSQAADIASKRLEIMREALPNLRRLAIAGNLGNLINVLEIAEVQAAARAFGLESAVLGIRRAEDIAPAFEAFGRRAEALYVCGDPLIFSNRAQFNTLALESHLPTIYTNREYAEARGLMSYGPNFHVLFRRAAELVDKILLGAKAEEIQVEQPTKFDLVINLATAKLLCA